MLFIPCNFDRLEKSSPRKRMIPLAEIKEFTTQWGQQK